MSPAVPPDPPPFTLAQLRRAVPARCFRPDPLRSTGFLLRDLTGIALLGAAALALDHPVAWLLYAAAQGSLFFALFAIGHDCGHGAFSGRPGIDAAMGTLCHAPLLVPFAGWRRSHRIHHAHTADPDRDEGFHPLRPSEVARSGRLALLVRFELPLLAFPLYLLRRSPGRRGSHFHPGSPLLRPGDRRAVGVGTACCVLVLGALVLAAFRIGPGRTALLYLAPYLVFCGWLALVTFLHHLEPGLPFYRGEAWTPLRGALSTVDRSYGWLDRVLHHPGLHVAHHLFPAIPHYRLPEATAALRTRLGPWYRTSQEPILRAFLRVRSRCRVVPEEGLVVQAGPCPRPWLRRRGAGPRPATRW